MNKRQKKKHRDLVYLKRDVVFNKMRMIKKNTMRLQGMTSTKEQKVLLRKKHKTMIILRNVCFLFYFNLPAIYQSGPLDLPPGGLNTRTLV